MIPKIIHYIWIGEKPIPKEYHNFIDEWPLKLPGFTFKLWDEESYELGLNDFALKAFASCKWAFVSDYMRIRILYEYGGIYLDIDEKIIKSLECFCENEVFFGQEPGFRLQAGVLGCEPHHQILKAILDYYDTLEFDPHKTSQYIIGDVIYSVLLKLYPELKLSDQPQNLGEGILIYPSKYFCPDLAMLNDLKYAYTIHLPNASWLNWRHRMKIKIYKTLMQISICRKIYSIIFR